MKKIVLSILSLMAIVVLIAFVADATIRIRALERRVATQQTKIDMLEARLTPRPHSAQTEKLRLLSLQADRLLAQTRALETAMQREGIRRSVTPAIRPRTARQVANVMPMARLAHWRLARHATGTKIDWAQTLIGVSIGVLSLGTMILVIRRLFGRPKKTREEFAKTIFSHKGGEGTS